MNESFEVEALGPGDLTGSVEPDESQGTVPGEKLRKLGFDLGLEIRGETASALFWPVPGVSGRFGLVPVLILRVIKAESNPSLFTGPGQVFHRILFIGSCGHNIERISLGIEHRKSIVVL